MKRIFIDIKDEKSNKKNMNEVKKILKINIFNKIFIDIDF
jgi:hypothetical protein